MKKKNVMKVVKVILIILLAVILFFLINSVRKYIIAKELSENVKQYTSSENYHIKSVTTADDGTKTTVDYYKKENKEALFTEKDQDGEIYKISMYNNGERKDIFYDNSEGKKAELDANFTTQVEVVDYFDMQTDLQLFFGNMFAQIKKTKYNGKECYCLKNSSTLTFLLDSDSNEVYIEKDTGLIIKTNMGGLISEREYEFDTVQAEIFAEPDISQYELIES